MLWVDLSPEGTEEFVGIKINMKGAKPRWKIRGKHALVLWRPDTGLALHFSVGQLHTF
jgi:hypothetical protein